MAKATKALGLTPTALLAQLQKTGAAAGLAPVYVLSGEEAFYTDKLVDAFEALIADEDRDFDLQMLYAPEHDMQDIHEACRRYPMLSPRQVVIVKECQSLTANELDKLAPYAAVPNQTTVLVLVFRGAAAKGKGLLAAVKKAGGQVVESPKIKDASAIITGLVRDAGLTIDQKGLMMLTSHVGTDLSRLHNEVQKLTVALPAGGMITAEAVERHVGISKDYNVFELNEALARRDGRRAFEILAYFRANPKAAAFPVIIATIYSYFVNLVIYHFTADKSPSSIMGATGIKWPRQVDSLSAAARLYNAWQVLDIIHALRDADTRSKGIGSRQEPFDLLHDLIYRILTTTGR